MRTQDKLIKDLFKNDPECVFISPHLDDAILSCAALLMSLRIRFKLSVITVFTQADSGAETEFVRWFVKGCGYADSQRLFQDRRVEDKIIFEKLNIDLSHLNFIDAAWRKKPFNRLILNFLKKISPELIHIYPSLNDVFGGKISHHDFKIKDQISQELINKIDKRDIIIFAPLGIGNHIDHLIVREICAKSFKRVIYWSDFPYSLRKQADENFIKTKRLSSFAWDDNLEIKKKLISLYRTQFDSLFPSGIVPSPEEVYFFNEKAFHKPR